MKGCETCPEAGYAWCWLVSRVAGPLQLRGLLLCWGCACVVDDEGLLARAVRA